jgi:ATP-dependent DNA ligase
MRDYSSFQYIYPPRPEVVAPPGHEVTLEETHWGQPKMDGSFSILATDGKELHFMNRHKEEFSNKLLIKPEEMKAMHRGKGWIYLVGEYMNKSKKGADGKTFNGKFVLVDILVYENLWLIGMTFEERQNLLDKIFSSTKHDGWIEKISENCFRAINVKGNLTENWKKLVKVDMYEGMVYKRANAKLETSFKEKNNTGWQLKIRKPTKNYSY